MLPSRFGPQRSNPMPLGLPQFAMNDESHDVVNPLVAAALQRERSASILAAAALQRRQDAVSRILQSSSVLPPPEDRTSPLPSFSAPTLRQHHQGITDPSLRELRERGLATDSLLLANAIAAERQLQLAAQARKNAMMSEAYRRGREEALLMLLQSGASLQQPPPADQESKPPALPSVVDKKSDAPNEGALASLGVTSVERRRTNAPYFDASSLSDPDPSALANRRARGGVVEPFPERLHRMLKEVDEQGEAEVVSFFPHGRAFAVHNPTRFVADIMPKYFRQSRLSSFQRQLNLYGFTRITSGPDVGGYYHELFLKGRPALCVHMRRVGVNQTGGKGITAKPSPHEPDFYKMRPVSGGDDDDDQKVPGDSSR